MTRMRAGRTPVSIGLAVLLIAAGCRTVAAPAQTSSPSDPVAATASPAATVASTQPSTPAPTLPPAPEPSSAPSATVPAVVSPAPLTELEALLPSFAGASYLELRVLTAADFEGSYSAGPVFHRILTRTGRTVADFEGASATGPISVIALRLRDVAAQDLADDFIDASLAENPDGSATPGKIGGRAVRTLHWPNDPFLADRSITVMVSGTVVLIASAAVDDQALVVDALTSMFEPKLETVLPATLAGRPLTRYSFPAASVGTTGDMCAYVCPGEPQAMAAKVGVKIADVDVALGLLPTKPSIVIVAMRFPGAPTKGLVAARIALASRPEFPFEPETLTIAGKAVTFAVYGPVPMLNQEEYLYAHDHVLYMIQVEPGTKPVPAIVTAAIKALP